MNKKIPPEKILAIAAIILSAVFMRLIPHAPNMSPIGALALFSGIVMPNIMGISISLIALFISDLFLGFHATMPFVYGSFVLIAMLGYILRKKVSLVKVGIGSLLGSILFFIITNFGVWLTSAMYEKNIGGLVRAYDMGIPFFRNTLFGDLLYNAIFFMSYVVFQSVSKKTIGLVKRLFHYHLS